MPKALDKALRLAKTKSSFNHNSQRVFTTPRDIAKAYKSGLIGCVGSQELDESWAASMAWPKGEEAAHEFGIAESGKGKLSLSFMPTMELFKEKGTPLPGPAQRRGDCVSHAAKNAALLTMCCEIVSGEPDEVTKRMEGLPEISSEGVNQGVLSSEANYWWRDHNGDGWHCGHSCQVLVHESGVWVRKDYPDFGFDLTQYDSRLAGKWGRPNPPQRIKDFGLQHAIRTSTRLREMEAVRDFIANGYGISHCGGEGFSSKRDKYGVSKRSGSWAHAMALGGADDRDLIKQVYGETLFLVVNSWGSSWISGPRQIMGTNLLIPHGCFWARWSDIRRRSFFGLSGFNGFPPQKLPDYGFDYLAA